MHRFSLHLFYFPSRKKIGNLLTKINQEYGNVATFLPGSGLR